MKHLLIFTLLLIVPLSAAAQKKIFIPRSISGMNLNSAASEWSYSRSVESDNVIIFWEAGYGSDPSTASGSYRVDTKVLLSVAEKCFSFYTDSLQFAIKGSSVVDKYKLIIFLTYSTDWAANGSGEDDTVGALWISAAAAIVNNVVAHELGHCFQYIAGCDGNEGYRYGYGADASGENGFWEQCANWMSFKVYPEKQFTENVFKEYIAVNHLHIIHETPRYANYFLPDYWTYKHDRAFMGKLWRESRTPEDPIETYKRLSSLSQAQFNDEMYDHASRLTTWDLPAIRAYGEKYIDSRVQVKMSLTSDSFWLIDPSVCIENYGYNSIKLNAPSQAQEVTALFKGKTGATGFRALKTDKGGWRYGFVALLKDGTRKYSVRGIANVVNGGNPDQSLSFACPANCTKLWFVVSGAPQEHWRHPWDDNTSNDEQWPYQVQFKNTNLLGQKTGMVTASPKGNTSGSRPVLLSEFVYLPEKSSWQVTDLAGRLIRCGFGDTIQLDAFLRGGYIVNYSNRYFKIIRN